MENREEMLDFLLAVRSFGAVNLYQGMMPEWVSASCREGLSQALIERGCVAEGCISLASGTFRGLKLTDKGLRTLADPDNAFFC